jgi:hypothetical protein
MESSCCLDRLKRTVIVYCSSTASNLFQRECTGNASGYADRMRPSTPLGKYDVASQLPFSLPGVSSRFAPPEVVPCDPGLSSCYCSPAARRCHPNQRTRQSQSPTESRTPEARYRPRCACLGKSAMRGRDARTDGDALPALRPSPSPGRPVCPERSAARRNLV